MTNLIDSMKSVWTRPRRSLPRQSTTSPQANEAIKRALGDKDNSDTAFYGFSGGGYNMYWPALNPSYD